jgi:acyl-CoA reductase-like NAD-dependent aldehyde dehydrogenase
MPVMQEEVFAPVLPVIKFNKVNEAVEVANNSKYGLGAYVYTKDSENISYFEENLESGMISVNNVSYIRPYNPFIGHKYSGIGVENGRLGFEDVTKPKLISMPNENE